MAKKRNYKDEYDDYHGTPEQVKRRAQRNKARSTAEKKGLVRKGDSLEVHHTASNRKGPLGKGVKVISRAANRKKQPKRNGKDD